MKSYYDAHESAYKRIKSKGYAGWGDKRTLAELGDANTIEYLKSSISKWAAPNKIHKKALDLGCGTGTTAFTMAQMGLNVTGIDISETAIEMARDFAANQNLKIEFVTGDILQLESLNRKFNVIYDSHCLHCIVFTEDRQRVYQGIKSSLVEDGIFILDTTVNTESWDPTAPFDTLRFDENYILWHKTPPSNAHGVVEVNGQYWCAQRRFYPASKILEEVEKMGFKILSQLMDPQEAGEPNMLRLVLKI
ncbi:MAG: class I SAM-dependent methyltransferase [Pseudobdellovibrionaceae bacterium]